MGGSTTISTSATKIDALKLQSSAYGVTVPVLYGTNRISGNMVWYGGFKAVAHTTSQSSGKGGGVKSQNTTYSYTAGVMMGLCEGSIIGIPRAWKGKQLYDGGSLSSAINTSTETYTVASGSAYTYTVANAANFTTPIAVGYAVVIGVPLLTRILAEGVDYTRNGGVYVFAASLAGVLVGIKYQWNNGGTNAALSAMGLSLATGQLGQPVWSYLTANFPAQAVGYSGLAYVYSSAYDLGTTAQVDNHTFEVQGPQAYSISTAIPDANHCLAGFDLLTNDRYGATFPSSQIEDITAWRDYRLASGLLMSPVLTEQQQAGEFITLLCSVTNTAPVWASGKLKMVPLGDTTMTANGVTYTPNTTPVFDLGDSDYTPASGGDPVVVTRKRQADAYNHFRIEFLNRANLYNIEIAEAKDSANIDSNGLRSAPIVVCHWICEVKTARTVAQLMMQRSMYVRNTYAFSLPWTKAMLEPTDLVTLTDSGLGLSKLPVRIIEIDETEEGDLQVIAEDYPFGASHAPTYPSQSGSGFQHNYNADPGSVSTPVIFEAPVNLTTSGLEVYAAVAGISASWGGCRVWVSMDGTNYRDAGVLSGGSRYGTLTGPIASGTLPILLNAGVLASGSAADSAALTTLLYIGGASPEYLAYQVATLTSALAYSLTGLTRAGYGTTATAHATSDPVARIDASIAKSGTLDLSMIGRTIYFKFTSINIYGAAEQSLSAVTQYPYLITGSMAKIAPVAITGLTAVAEPFGIRVSCNKAPEVTVVRYEYRSGPTWAGGALLEPSGGTSYLWKVQSAATYTVWVAAVDKFGNYSTPVSASCTVAGGTISGIVSTIVGANLTLTWAAVANSFSTAGYEIRYGATWALGTVIDFRQTTSYTESVKWGGSRTYWIAPLDVKGNYGTPSSIAVTVNVPSVPTASRSDVVDNNALLYWTAPVIGVGQLSVERYECRKGATFAGGTVIGSNGNSTFTSVFEQSSGTYTYWIAAVDTAGNIGTAVSIVAKINQPPDYVLSNNFDSALSGTLVNLYASSGVLLGPVLTTETWATHFSTRTYLTPADQVTAGFPIYADPSQTTGSYEEIVIYAADGSSALPSTVATATINSTTLSGTVTTTCTLSWRLLSTDVWTVLTAGATTALLPSFRQVRVHYDFACTAGANLIQINGLNLKLAIKSRTDSGTGTAIAGGTVVTFAYAFISANTPIVQPNGATPLVPVVIYAGGVNPTTFTVKLYNLAGTDVGGAFSWSARGY